MNPYKVLGVPPDANKSEIERAYEKLVDTYNMQNYDDNDDQFFAEDKLSEANEAFNLIISEMKYKEIRNLIENEEFLSAETELNLIADSNSPEWNYLKGFVMLKKGWVQSGVTHLKTAAELNPSNTEYKETMTILSRKINNMKQNYAKTQAAMMQRQMQSSSNNNNMNMCGGGGAPGGNMCGGSGGGDMSALANMMGGGANNPLSSMMGGGAPTMPNTNNSAPAGNMNMNSNPLQNMLLQNMMSGGGGNMCGSGGGGGLC